MLQGFAQIPGGVKSVGGQYNIKAVGFEPLPEWVLLDIQGTEFQQKVWNELLKIPFGSTRSYMDIAKSLGDPKSIRAVGTANGKNKISIIIPCHRVIGTDGSLTGFGGGIQRKKWLLEHEAKYIQGELFKEYL